MFKDWMDKVDVECQKIAMVSIYDIADWDFYSAYENGYSPREAAIEALESDDLFSMMYGSIDNFLAG